MKSGILLLVVGLCSPAFGQGFDAAAEKCDEIPDDIQEDLDRLAGSDLSRVRYACSRLPSRLKTTGLGACRGPATDLVVPALIKTLAHYDPSVRYSAMAALGNIGNDAATARPAVVKMLTEQDVALSEWSKVTYAISVIADFGKDSLPTLSTIAASGLRGLGDKPADKFKSLRVVPFDENNFEDCQIRLAAINGIGVLKTPDAVPVLLKILPAAERTKPRRIYAGNSQRDLVLATLKAIGESGVNDEKVTRAVSRFSKAFPKETDTILRKLKAG